MLFLGNFGTITYAIEGTSNSDGNFQIDAAGDITILSTTNVDYETSFYYLLTVYAIDGSLNTGEHTSSVWRQKGLTGYCCKYIDRPFCL